MSRHLEHEPLIELVLLWNSGVGEAFFLVVRLNQILDDCTGLPEFDTGVGVFNGWESAVGIDARVWSLLDFGDVHQVDCVW